MKRNNQGILVDEEGTTLEVSQYENETGHPEGGEADVDGGNYLSRDDQNRIDVVMDNLKGANYEEWELCKEELKVLYEILRDIVAETELEHLALKVARAHSYKKKECELNQQQQLEYKHLISTMSEEDAMYEVERLGTTKAVLGQFQPYCVMDRVSPINVTGIQGVSYAEQSRKARNCIMIIDSTADISRIRARLLDMDVSIIRIDKVGEAYHIELAGKHIEKQLVNHVSKYDISPI